MNTRHALIKQINIQGLKDYLMNKEWKEEPFGRAEVLRFKSPQPVQENRYLEVLIPSKRELVDYNQVVEIAIDCISAFEDRSVDDVLSDMLPCALIELMEIKDLILEGERLRSKHRDNFALSQSLKSLKAREQDLTDELSGVLD